MVFIHASADSECRGILAFADKASEGVFRSEKTG